MELQEESWEESCVVCLFSTTARVSSQNVTELMVYLPLLARGT